MSRASAGPSVTRPGGDPVSQNPVVTFLGFRGRLVPRPPPGQVSDCPRAAPRACLPLRLPPRGRRRGGDARPPPQELRFPADRAARSVFQQVRGQLCVARFARVLLKIDKPWPLAFWSDRVFSRTCRGGLSRRGRRRNGGEVLQHQWWHLGSRLSHFMRAASCSRAKEDEVRAKPAADSSRGAMSGSLAQPEKSTGHRLVPRHLV